MRVAVFSTSRSDFDVALHLFEAVKTVGSATVYFYANDSLIHLFPNVNVSPLGISLRDASSDEYKNLVDAVRARIDEDKFDVGVVVGDRWETLLIAQILVSLGIKLIHHSGGDLTNGSLDNAYRYACTMLASVHWVSASPHRDRLVKLGIPADQVFFVGEPQLGVKRKAAKDFLAEDLGISFDFSEPYMLVCVHPSIDLLENFEYALGEIRSFLESQPLNVLFTAPNHDLGALEINQYWRKLVSEHEKWQVVDSLGSAFANVLHRSACLLGNSSAGMFEASTLGVPVINLGSRQDGRLRGGNVVDCGFKCDQMHKALNRVTSLSRSVLDSPYYNEDWQRVVRESLVQLASSSCSPSVGIVL